MDITAGRLQYMLERLNTTSTVAVETFGAVGNGVTDDTAAIQAAFDYAHTAGGGLVQFTPGKTYAVSTFLVVYDYTTVYAYGATIKAIGNTGLLRNFRSDEVFNAYAGHSHIQVLGGIWDGNAFNGTTGSVTAETDVMNFVHCTDITVRDAIIRNVSTAHALEFNSTDGGKALNCRFEGYQDNSSDQSRQFSEAVQIDISVSGSSSIGSFDNTPSKNILVDGCVFTTSDRCGKFGRAVGSHTTASGQAYYGIQVVNNRIDGTIQEGIRGYGWRRAVISNNIINNTGYSAIWMGGPNPSSAGYTLNIYDITITGNTITGPLTDSGIRVIGFSGCLVGESTINGNSVDGASVGNANGIHVEYCNSPVVVGNSLANVMSTGIFNNLSDSGTITGNTLRNTQSNGINVSGSTGTVVSSNHVNSTTTNHCIFVGNSSNDFLVTANRVVNAKAAGIRMSGTATDGTIDGNRIVKGTSVNGITSDSTATGCIVANNDLSGNGWATATAISMGATTTFSFGGGTTSPGFNRVS
jgi:hypothetical protein